MKLSYSQWSVNRHKENYLIIAADPDGSVPKVLAQVVGVEALENAQLMARAPELLFVAKRAHELLQTIGELPAAELLKLQTLLGAAIERAESKEYLIKIL